MLGLALNVPVEVVVLMVVLVEHHTLGFLRLDPIVKVLALTYHACPNFALLRWRWPCARSLASSGLGGATDRSSWSVGDACASAQRAYGHQKLRYNGAARLRRCTRKICREMIGVRVERFARSVVLAAGDGGGGAVAAGAAASFPRLEGVGAYANTWVN